jgi:hypothetical protein
MTHYALRIAVRKQDGREETASAGIHVAMSHIMLRRLTHPAKRQHKDEHLLAHIE